MEVSMTKALSHGILLITLMMLLNTGQSGATSSSVLKDLHGLNATILADNIELEFLMDSEISRKLASAFVFVTLGTLDPSLSVIKDCGKGKPYKPCVPSGNNPKKPQPCDIYNRNEPCPKPK